MLAVTKTVSVEFARKKDPIIGILLHPGTVDTDLSKKCSRRQTIHERVLSSEALRHHQQCKET